MCEPECKICWFQKTSKVLHQLQLKSVDVTVHLNEAVKSVQTVNNVVGDFINTFNQLGALGENRPTCIEKETFIKETTSEEKQDDTVNKEEVPAVQPEKTNDKHLVEEPGNILFVNVTSGLANDGTFWCRYWSNEAQFNDSRLHQISDELGWMEKDLSAKKAETKASNQLLFCYSPVHELYLRSIILKHAPPEETEVRYIDLGRIEFVSVNIIFYYLPEDHQKKHPFLNLYCTLYDEESQDLKIPREAKWCFRDLTEERVLLARIVSETQKQGLPCYQLEMKTMTGVSRNINKEIKKMILDCEKEDERKAEAKVCKNNLFVPDGTHTKRDEKSQCVEVDTQVDKSRLPDVPHIITEDKSQPARNENSKIDISALKESLLLPNESNVVDKARSRRASGPPFFINMESHGIGQRSSSLSNIVNIDPKSVNLHIIKDEIKDACGKEKPVKKKQSDNVKKPVEKFQLLTDEYWVDKIPHEQRRVVPRKMAPLRNIFYSKYKLRSEKWYEIELMNINELLMSESNMAFYALPLYMNQIEQSFNNNCISYYKDKYIPFFNLVENRLGTFSQYFFMVNRSKDISSHSFQVYGIAKIESLQQTFKKHFLYISYYSLSNIGEYYIQYSSRNTFSLELTFSKVLVQKIKLSLECGKSIPVFENYYPWCGSPPIMDLYKPVFPPNQLFGKKKKKKSSEELRDKKQAKENRVFNDNKDHLKVIRKSPVNNTRHPVQVEQNNHTEELWDQEEVFHTKVEENKSTLSNGVNSLAVENEVQEITELPIVETTTVCTEMSLNSEDLKNEVVKLNCADPVSEEYSRDDGQINNLESVLKRSTNSDIDTSSRDQATERVEEDWNGNGSNKCTNNQSIDNEPKEVNCEQKEVAVADNGSAKETSQNAELEDDTKHGKSPNQVSVDNVSVDNVSETLSKPIKILQRPAKNVGFYDATGMWYPVEGESSTVATSTVCTSMSSNSEDLKHEMVKLNCSDSASEELAPSTDHEDINVTSGKSESVEIPLRKSDACSRDETNKRYEEDWNGNVSDNCSSNQIIHNELKVHNEPKEVAVVDNASAKDISENTECEDGKHGKLPNRVVSVDNVPQTSSKPKKILQRPIKNVGYYDATGMWYPDMDPAVVSYQSKIKVINDEFQKKSSSDSKTENEDEEKKNENLSKRYDESDKESLKCVVTSIETILETPPVVPDSSI